MHLTFGSLWENVRFHFYPGNLLNSPARDLLESMAPMVVLIEMKMVKEIMELSKEFQKKYKSNTFSPILSRLI